MLRPWKISLAERVDRGRSIPVYQQIVQALIHDIQRGRLLPGTFLPSSRELASTLGVNRKTIVLAYDDLIAQGWLASDGTRGTIVSDSLPDLAPQLLTIPPSDLGYESASPEFKIHPSVDPLPAFVENTDLTFDDGAPIPGSCPPMCCRAPTVRRCAGQPAAIGLAMAIPAVRRSCAKQ